MPAKPRVELSDDDVRAELERCGFGPGERYQIVLVDSANGRRLIATAADMEAIGLALKCLGEEGELDSRRVGILDRAAHKWLSNPYAGLPPR